MSTPHVDIGHAPVYPPAEDSYLLLDALEQDLEGNWTGKWPLVVDIGCGSGIQAAFVHQQLRGQCLVFATDINPFACRVSETTCRDVASVQTHLLAALLHRLAHQKADILLFNPPYVPSPPLQDPSTAYPATTDQYYEATWAGGTDGMQVTYQLLELVPQILHREHGILYLVVERENRLPLLKQYMQTHQLRSRSVLSRRCGREWLQVLAISWRG